MGSDQAAAWPHVFTREPQPSQKPSPQQSAEAASALMSSREPQAMPQAAAGPVQSPYEEEVCRMSSCGGNDPGSLPSVKLVNAMREDLLQLHHQHPGMQIILSAIPQRCRSQPQEPPKDA
uniref:Uncharacterized protein n=1 Tax=Knipowitschia caucasica TaxID=637954 RepID=A0AAV2LRG3_KNICA